MAALLSRAQGQDDQLPLPPPAYFPYQSVANTLLIHLFSNKYLLSVSFRQCHSPVLLEPAPLSFRTWDCNFEQLPLKLLWQFPVLK